MVRVAHSHGHSAPTEAMRLTLETAYGDGSILHQVSELYLGLKIVMILRKHHIYWDKTILRKTFFLNMI